MAAYENWKVELALASQPDDPFPVWTDITPWVETVNTPWSTQRGRPSELDTAQPGSMSLTLNNADHRFTPYNASSPYYPNFKAARRIRITETIGYRTFPVFNGWLELPDIEDWAEAGADQFITVTAVDRLTRLDRSRRFISTLAEWILYNGTGLQAYYPLLESSGTTFSDKGPYSRESTRLTYTIGPSVNPTQQSVPLTAGGGAKLAGDDLAGPTWSPRLDANLKTAMAYTPRATWSTGFVQSGSDIVTVAAWVKLGLDPAGTTNVFMEPVTLWQAGGGGFGLAWTADRWEIVAQLNTASAFVFPLSGPALGVPMLVAVRVNISTGVIEYWRHNDAPVTGTLSGTLPTSLTWNALDLGSGAFTGTVSHVQVYLGANAYPRAFHLAQITAGTVGLAGQLTGERIRTIAAYAGVPSGELDVDNGTARMQNAALAGKSPLETMRDAETTEQGLLIADGAGRLVFQDRTRRYNL